METRLDGVFFASPVATDGTIFFLSQTRETVVVKAGRTPSILARNDLGVRLAASPPISGGQIFLRSDGWRFAVGKARRDRDARDGPHSAHAGDWRDGSVRNSERVVDRSRMPAAISYIFFREILQARLASKTANTDSPLTA